MRDTTKEVIEYIDRRLSTMQRAPGTWGSSESLELQALLLLEVRTFVLRPRVYRKDPFEVRDAYIRFVAEHFPTAPASLMCGTLDADVLEKRLPELVSALGEEVIRSLGPEDPFETSDFALELQFNPSRAASFRAVSRYLLRSLRAVEKLAAERGTGQPRSILPWGLPDLRSGATQDGSPLVWLLFDRQAWRRTSSEQFLEALDRCMTMVECVRQDDERAIDRVRQRFPNEREREQVMRRTMGLCPKGKLVNVRLGGKALLRGPFIVEAAVLQRLEALTAPPPTRAPRLRIASTPESWWQDFPQSLPDEPPRFSRRAGAVT